MGGVIGVFSPVSCLMAGGRADKGVSTISEGNEAVCGVWSGGRDGFLVVAMLRRARTAILQQNE